MPLSSEEENLIDSCIKAYKRTINHIQKQIKDLENKKKDKNQKETDETVAG